MNSKEYWQERERKALRERIKEEQSYIRRVNGIHDDMLDKIQKEIDSFYQKYAIKEHISLAEAKKRVSQLDIKAYEEKARRYVEDKDLSSQANREMRLYNLTMKVNRLEMLKARIGMAMVDSFDGMNNFYEEVLSKRAMEEYERQAGILGKSVIDPEKKAKALVNASFKSATGKYGFSDVLWTQQTFMKAELSKLLQQGIMQGKGPRELAPQLQKIFGVEKYACERLMRTELARVQIEAQRQSFEENGYDEYQFITLSSAPYTKSKVCPICADLNGKHFKVKDMEIGENAPPMHPNCRCSIAAYMDPDEFEKWLDEHSDNQGIAHNNNRIDGLDDNRTDKELIDRSKDLTKEYVRNATPGKGFIEKEKGYVDEDNAREIEAANIIHKKLGGDITLKVERDGQKNPDYLWNGSLWDLKTTSTEASASSAIRTGMKQIHDNPGGIILNFGTNEINMIELKRVVDKRMGWYPDGSADIVVISNGEIIKVWRY